MLIWNAFETTLSADFGRGSTSPILAGEIGFPGADGRLR
jgi:hypothetical protein